MAIKRPRHNGSASLANGDIHIGTSGWIYKHWRGLFYPADLPPRQWLRYYTDHFDTVEINNSFYRLPSDETFESWREQAPKSFLYSVKASRFLTHMKKLKDPEEPIERILGRARRLGPSLGPVLYQLPRSWKCNRERLAYFFEKLPRDLSHVVEFRRADWLCEDVFKLMRDFHIGLCIHDLVPNHPELATSDVVYLRFHGAGVKYGGSYSNGHLRRWAEWCVAQRQSGRRVFAYFNNDAQGHAVRNAKTLLRQVRRLLK